MRDIITDSNNTGKESDNGDSEPLSGEDIENLVKNLNKGETASGKTKSGGKTREKFTCKCCGTRVDSGKHKCSRCIEAGCSFGDKKCKFA